MDNWKIICKIKDRVSDNEAGWRVVDLVWAFLDGTITLEEAAAEIATLTPDAEGLLAEVTGSVVQAVAL
jgi:hypothetical protein